jgi:WD40 repeat protein
MFMVRRVLIALAAVVAAAPAPAAAPVSFSRDIAPILARKCVTCHNAEKAKGKYRLDTFEWLLKPGASKAAPVTAGQPTKSELFRLLTLKDEDERMPQKDDPLPPGQIALIERWISEGAKFDGAERTAALATLLAAQPQPEPPAAYPRPVPVHALAFSPDGRELAAGGYHEVTIWDAESGRLLRRLRNVAERVHALAWRPDGRQLVVAGGSPGRFGEVKLFDPAEGKLLQRLAALSDVALAAAFSPDGKRLAVGGADNAIHLFDAASGRRERALEAHADWVMDVAFNADGTRLVSASRDRSARVFNPADGDLIAAHLDAESAVFSAVAGEGELVCGAGRDRKIFIWGEKNAKKAGELGGFGKDILRLIVDGDRLFSACADGRVREHSLKGKSLVRAFEADGPVYALAWHGESGRLAAAGHTGAVHVWKAADGALVTRFTAAPGLRAARP